MITTQFKKLIVFLTVFLQTVCIFLPVYAGENDEDFINEVCHHIFNVYNTKHFSDEAIADDYLSDTVFPLFVLHHLKNKSNDFKDLIIDSAEGLGTNTSWASSHIFRISGEYKGKPLPDGAAIVFPRSISTYTDGDWEYYVHLAQIFSQYQLGPAIFDQIMLFNLNSSYIDDTEREWKWDTRSFGKTVSISVLLVELRPGYKPLEDAPREWKKKALSTGKFSRVSESLIRLSLIEDIEFSPESLFEASPYLNENGDIYFVGLETFKFSSWGETEKGDALESLKRELKAAQERGFE